MLVLRLLGLGLCAACVTMVATLRLVRVEPPPPVVIRVAAPRVAIRAPEPSVNVVDAVQGVTPARLAAILRLQPSERITEINDRPLGDDLAAEEALAELAPRAGQYLDLTIVDAKAARRALILVH